MLKLPNALPAGRRTLWSLVAVAFLGTSTGAQGAAPKKKPAAAAAKKEEDKPAKKDDKKADAKAKDPKAKDAKPAAEGDAPAEDKPAGPEATKEEIRTSGPAKLARPVTEKDMDRSSAADKKRDAQIKDIQQILGANPDAATKGELVFRLAELYWDKSRFVLDQEMVVFGKDVDTWTQNGRKGPEPQPNHKKSDVYKKQALANYEIILEKYPEYPRRDEVLYIMASNTYEAGKKDKAVKHYWELIKQYPNSDYVGDAYLAMGEHYFNGNDVTKARKAYQKALETKKTKVYSYALYKLAWCDYNLQEWDGAIKKFKQVVEYSEKQLNKKEAAGMEKKDNLQLKSEALNDLTLTFTHVEAVDTAYDYLKLKGGEPKARKLTGKLATLYFDQGKYDQAVQTYRLLINNYPDDPDCPDFQSSIVAAYFKLNKKDDIRTEVKRLVDLYRPGTPWWKKNEKNKRVLARARETAEERMRELVTDTHQVYTKLKKKDDAELARDMYSDYLKVFPDSEYAYRLRFFYAEILWDLGDWEVAASQYDATVEMDKANAFKGEYSRQAAYNAILAYEKIAKGEKKGEFTGEKKAAQGPKAGGKEVKRKESEGAGFTAKAQKIDKSKKYEEEVIPETEIKLSAACDRYVAVVPVGEKTPKELTDELVLVKFKAGAIYQQHFHFGEAAKRFEELIDRWPTHEFARKGADLVLDSWDYRENWTELNRVGRKFQKNKNLMSDASFAERVNKFVEGSSFKEIMAINEKGGEQEKEGKKKDAFATWGEAANRFLAFQKEFHTSQFADKAVYNAIVIYNRAEQLDLAIESGELLLKQYEKSEQIQPTVLFLGSFYERVADFRRAAEYYEQYVTKYGKDPKAHDALYNAAVFHQGLGDRKKAIELFGKYMKDYKEKEDVPDIYWRVAKMYEEDGDFKRAGVMFGEYEKQFPKANPVRLLESHYLATMQVLKEPKREPEARAQCEDLLKRAMKLGDAAKKDSTVQRVMAHCHFMGLEPKFQEYMAIKLELPMAKLTKNLEAKATKLEQLKNEYTTVLGYGDGAFGVASLFRVAAIHHDFAKALKESPDPPRLDPEQLDIYRSELEGQTFPVDEKAIQALEAALGKAFELGIYNEWTARSQDLLKEYKPNEFPPAHQMPFYYADFSSSAGSQDGGEKK